MTTQMSVITIHVPQLFFFLNKQAKTVSITSYFMLYRKEPHIHLQVGIF